ncbi:MAG TPA: serine/threonine-protein kinase [Enhygromyxa sp.]|nr:serine/threonine-protein kinase [Enhygromyxa sp.]
MRTDERESAGDETIVETSERRVDEAPLAVGATIDRFVVLSIIGEGGLGRVYAAYDPELDRQIALKLLKRASGPSDEHEVARVRREAQALAKITHPNVVTVYDVGQHEGRLYLAMEFVSGQTLRSWVQSRRPAWREIVEAFVAAGHGLLAVHEAGLVHRDVKPDNIMIGDDGRVRVMDFGLAREGHDLLATTSPNPVELRGSTTLTRTGAVAGTPAYMAPEQHLGRPFDARTDQFALCVSLWEMLYAERPFAGDNLAALAFNVTQGERRSAPSDSPVPGWVRRAIERGLALDPASRYPSLAELLHALRHDPSARRRRALLAVAGVALLGTSIAWLWSAGPTREQASPCAQVETLDAVWDPTQSPAALAHAFERSGSPLAAEVSVRTAEQLDAWAQQWNAARRDSCEATHVRREQSEALMDARIACLDRRRARVAALVDAFMQADAELVREAPTIVAKLDSLASCSDSERLRAATPLPDDAELAATISSLSLQIEALAARLDTGHTLELLTQARELASNAEQTGHAPLRVDAALLVADIEEVEISPRQSLATTEAAYYLALQEDLIDRAALAAVKIMWRTSAADPLSPTLDLWSAHARVLVQRVEPEGPLEAGRLVNAGIIEWSRGDNLRAVELTRAAIPIAERSYGARSVMVADYRNNLGYLTSMLDQHEEAKAHFEFALAVWSEVLGPNHPRLSVAQLSLAEIALEQERFADARTAAEHGLRVSEVGGEGDSANAAYALNVLAELDRRDGKLDEARSKHERALAITSASMGADHWRSAQASLGLGEVALLERDFATATQEFEAAARVFEPLGANKRQHGRALLGLARAEAGLGRWTQARAHAARARERFIEIGRRGERDLAELDAWLAETAPSP